MSLEDATLIFDALKRLVNTIKSSSQKCEKSPESSFAFTDFEHWSPCLALGMVLMLLHFRFYISCVVSKSCMVALGQRDFRQGRFLRKGFVFKQGRRAWESSNGTSRNVQLLISKAPPA